MQKLYCYVEESGQDVGSEYFVVVVVANCGDQERAREKLLTGERESKTGARKWHKSRIARSLQYLELAMREDVGAVYYGHFRKPLPYFLPVLETLEGVMALHAKGAYTAVVYVDGIDRKKAVELTNALRLRGLRVRMVRSARDESEPMIRLADRWAGCIRSALRGQEEQKTFFENACARGRVTRVK